MHWTVRLRISTVREQVGTPAKKVRGLTIICNLANSFGGNRRAHPHLDGFSGLIQQFMRETRGAQHRMDQSKNMEGQTITSGKEHGDNRRTADANQTRCGVAPLRIADLAMFELPVRDLSCGKHDQHSARAEMMDGLLQPSAVVLLRMFAVEWIDKYAIWLQLWDRAQKVVRQNLYIRANA